MLRITTCICLCFLGGSIAQAQRLLPKQKGISLSWVAPAEAFTSSFSDDFGVQLGYSINAKRGNYKHFSLEYQRRLYPYKSLNIPVERYIGAGGYSFALISDSSKTVALNLGAEALLGYEVVNHSKSLLPDGALLKNENNFLYGAQIGLQVETYLSDHFLVLCSGKVAALWGSSFELLRPCATVGLRYMF